MVCKAGNITCEQCKAKTESQKLERTPCGMELHPKTTVKRVCPHCKKETEQKVMGGNNFNDKQAYQCTVCDQYNEEYIGLAPMEIVNGGRD